MAETLNGIGWFEIGIDDPAVAERFYGGLFGWTFGDDADAGMPYRLISTPAADSIQGGIFPTGGKAPNYAIFYVAVADVAETCRRAEAAGGKVVVPATTNADGLTFAHLLDPAGSQFGVFAPSPKA